jgi:hypothetical protein
MFRAIEFILLYKGSDACLPACDTKPQGLLKLISDEVPHRFIELILQSDPPGTKYTSVYKFFTRVAVYTKRCEILHREAKFFRASFGGSKFNVPLLQQKFLSLRHMYPSASGHFELPGQ